MARYETGRKEASLPFIVCHAVRNISSPFVGYFGKRFGLITVTGIGCLLATIGIGTCFFAEDIVAVILLWGIIYGLGFGMGTGLLPQILSQHFEEHIDKANGFDFGGGTKSLNQISRKTQHFPTGGFYTKKSGEGLPGTPNQECASSNSFLVFLDVTYIIILITQGLMQIVLTTVWTVIVDASKDKGFADSDGVYIMICLGVTEYWTFCLGFP
ncbi:uncharacterized protein TNIN_299731 [Trichonephila inaurata madagascariensis]|uniref:Uncharacterized protein n=1 Tax=Trichonephila inaurata madagascariensis TaxID=2747483 RepID=A0A8X6XJY3_9ARAC|nr:uncharacterized protein TNIN_299731 [Trichonephila inaurata madagascariensis]